MTQDGRIKRPAHRAYEIGKASGISTGTGADEGSGRGPGDGSGHAFEPDGKRGPGYRHHFPVEAYQEGAEKPEIVLYKPEETV